MMETIQKISITVLIVYILIGLFLYMTQKSLLYFPTPNMSTSYPSMTFKNDGETISVIVLNEGNENAILYFGGNAESMARSADYIARQFPYFTVYLMDYRGYGASTGEPSEETLYSDALKLYDSIEGKHKRISLGGRSLGSGIATYVAANREVSKLALITPFDSIVSVAQAMYPIYPARILLHANAYDSASRAKDISADIFIVMAENDRVIARKNSENLIEAFQGKNLKVDTIENRGHNDISSDERYYKIMQDFIGKG